MATVKNYYNNLAHIQMLGQTCNMKDAAAWMQVFSAKGSKPGTTYQFRSLEMFCLKLYSAYSSIE